MLLCAATDLEEPGPRPRNPLPGNAFMNAMVSIASVAACLCIITGPAHCQEQQPPAPPPEGLPRVLIIGDSISIDYTPVVERLLEGKAVVVHNPGNALHTAYGLDKLDEWLGDEPWDVIHFNWGLHDVKYVLDGKLDLRGTRVSSDAAYRWNLEKLVIRLRATGARLIWASTTPIPAGSAGRVRGEEVSLNRIAAERMRRSGIPVNDLHQAVSPKLQDLQRPANVHFTDEGYEFLGRLVAEHILEALTALDRKVPGAGGHGVTNSDNSE